MADGIDGSGDWGKEVTKDAADEFHDCQRKVRYKPKGSSPYDFCADE